MHTILNNFNFAILIQDLMSFQDVNQNLMLHFYYQRFSCRISYCFSKFVSERAFMCYY